MKLKNLLIFLIILTILINISCINASDNNTEILNENNDHNIYINPNEGNDNNPGDSWQTPIRTIQKAIDLTDSNTTTNIYLSNGTFMGNGNTQLQLENKNIINIIGSENTIISGENLNKILCISNTTKITMKNIQFVNATISSDYGCVAYIMKEL